jgi:flavin-dependent dehydrogenase
VIAPQSTVKVNDIRSIRRVIVIGAGPAGAAAAMRLHDQGRSVLWVDRSNFPRPKVCGCCLNLAAIGGLALVRCDQTVRDLVAGDLRYWKLENGGRKIDASLPGGIAVSRTRMDMVLIDEARRRGIEVRTNCDARIVDVTAKSVVVRLADASCDEMFDVAMLATGLSGGGVSRWLPWVQEPSGPLGAGIVVDELPGVAPQTIHMICGDQGYVGLVQLEDGRVDVAAALRKEKFNATGSESIKNGRAEILNQINSILASSSLGTLPQELATSLMTTPPLHRQRRAGSGRLLAIGDAAGYVEPFTGEGMAWAIGTGIAAADCVAGDRHDGDLGQMWCDTYAVMMRKRQWICRALSQSLASPSSSRWLMRGMHLAPWIVRRAIWRLNQPMSAVV